MVNKSERLITLTTDRIRDYGRNIMRALNRLDERFEAHSITDIDNRDVPTAPGAEGSWEKGYMGVEPAVFDASIDAMAKRARLQRHG